VIELGPAALATAFAAGFLSFTSPCVLPLVPGYLTFVAFGAGAAWFGTVLIEHRRPLEIAAGIFVIFAGLVFAGLSLPLALLRELRLPWPRIGRPIAPGLAGVAFAIGWTPCVGPTLAAILALSAAGASPEQGAVLLAIYALGLGVPFLAFGLAFTQALTLTRALRRHWRLVNVASGMLLIGFGVLLATGELADLTSRLSRFAGVEL
jgi:cytochrome c-type biogenesis protein